MFLATVLITWAGVYNYDFQEAEAVISVDTDEYSSSDFGDGTSDPQTFTHRIDAGSDIVLVVFVCVESGDDFGDTTGDIDWSGDGGHDLIQGHEIQADLGAEIWYVGISSIASDDTSGTISIINGGGKKMIAGAVNIFGADTSDIIDVISSDSGNNGDQTLTFTTLDPDVMSFETMCSESGGTKSGSDGQTEVYDLSSSIAGAGYWDQLTTAQEYIQDIDNTENGKKFAGVGITVNGIKAPIINIDIYDVYEIDVTQQTTLGTGFPICVGVDADTAQTCVGTLYSGRIYRIEIEVDETAGNPFTPTSFDIDVSVGDFDVLGDADFVAIGNYVFDSGCEDHADWTESYVGGTDIRSTAGTTTNCVIQSGADGTDEFWIIFRIHSSAGATTDPTLTFTVTDGTVTDTSALQTFRVSNILE